jgi:hypothetical protein
LPQETPPSDPWPRVAARLSARRRLHWPLGLAAAAALVLAIVLPLRLAQHAPAPATVAADTDAATLQRLLTGSKTHAVRRIHEMEAAERLLDDLGVPARVTRASRDWLADLADGAEP